MNAKLKVATALLVSALAVTAWAVWEDTPQRQAARIDARLVALAELDRAQAAERIRDQAECLATAVELPAAADSCWAAYRAVDAIGRNMADGWRAEARELRAARVALGR